MQTWIATSPEIEQLPELNGKRVVSKPLFLPSGRFSGHGTGNGLVLMELNGVAHDGVDYLDPDELGPGSSADLAIAAVRDGRAQACFINTERAVQAEAAGLRVHRLPEMPMIHSITLTTTTTRLLKDDRFATGVIKALLEAVHIFRTDREATLDLLSKPVYPLADRYVERVRSRYDHYASEYDTRLLPELEAIKNVYKLACMAYPGSEKVNPTELWDLHWLREVLDSGFMESLYGPSAGR
jgi:hypothetical protein